MIYVLQNKHTNYMKKVILALMLLAGYTAEAQQKTGIIYDNNVQKRNVGNFNAIKISNAIDLYITQSNSCEVAVSASNEEARDKIVTEVQGGTLIIRMKEESGWNWKKWGDIKAKAYVSVKELNALTASGACDVRVVDKIESQKLKIQFSGASDFKGNLEIGTLSATMSGASSYKGSLKANALFLDLSGASDVTLNGTADDLVIELSGASEANLFDLYTKAVKVQASGASSAEVNVAQLLKAQASGASSIEYKGNAAVKELNSTGASSVKRRN
ncbi:MAG: hypothetical protein RL363_1161 [Bacteroidota bacterium]